MVQTRTSTRLNGEASPHRQSSRSSPAASFSEAESKQSIERILSPGTSDQRQLQGVGCRTSARMTARSARSTANLTIIAAEHIRSPATALDRQDWQGWCEIESEPAFFNAILRDLGVQDIKVQEVISLDEEMLAYMSKPVYGLIFLFQYQEDGSLEQEATCPDHVWFANQTTSNACASIAMLNIIMNVPGLELGSNLEALKTLTANLNPAMRGHEVSNNKFLREIHNSFTRRMDMLNSDLALSHEARAVRYKKKSSRRKKNDHEDEDEPGFHFVAYAPIKGNVWRLDGLERQPTNLGPYNGDWMCLARPLISERMQQYEGEQIHFNLLSLCRSPLCVHRRDLAVNICSLNTVETRLGSIQSDWPQFVEQQDELPVLRGPDILYGVTREMLDEVRLDDTYSDGAEKFDLPVTTLLEMRLHLISNQGSIKAAILEGEAVVEEENEKARSRHHDYTPLISTWTRLLAENGLLKQLSEG